MLGSATDQTQVFTALPWISVTVKSWIRYTTRSIPTATSLFVVSIYSKLLNIARATHRNPSAKIPLKKSLVALFWCSFQIQGSGKAIMRQFPRMSKAAIHVCALNKLPQVPGTDWSQFFANGTHRKDPMKIHIRAQQMM